MKKLILTILITNASYGCFFDGDCYPGKCVKSGSYGEGVCLSKEIYKKASGACDYSTDCDYGYACIKQGYGDGVCMKKK